MIRWRKRQRLSRGRQRHVAGGEVAASGYQRLTDAKIHARLAQICIQSRSQVLEVLGEQLAIRSAPPLAPLPPPEFSFSTRTDGIRLKY